MWNFPWRPPAQNNIFHKIHFPKHSGKILCYSMCCFWRNRRIIESSHLSYCQKLQANESFNLLIRRQNTKRNYIGAQRPFTRHGVKSSARSPVCWVFIFRRIKEERCGPHSSKYISIIVQLITCWCVFLRVEMTPQLLQFGPLLKSRWASHPLTI